MCLRSPARNITVARCWVTERMQIHKRNSLVKHNDARLPSIRQTCPDHYRWGKIRLLAKRLSVPKHTSRRIRLANLKFPFCFEEVLHKPWKFLYSVAGFIFKVRKASTLQARNAKNAFNYAATVVSYTRTYVAAEKRNNASVNQAV